MPKPAAESGGKVTTQEILTDAKRQVEVARAEEARQLNLLGPPTPEQMAQAKEKLGPRAGSLAVLAEARRHGGRKPGSRNRRTEDFRKYILGFGRHPAITLMEIANTPPEVLIERSKVLDSVKKQMSYGDAQALRVRCAEGLMPFVESKMPVAVDFSAEGDFNLIIPGLNVSVEDAERLAAGQFVLEGAFEEVADGDESDAA
jgi:hypothetical protein